MPQVDIQTRLFPGDRYSDIQHGLPHRRYIQYAHDGSQYPEHDTEQHTQEGAEYIRNSSEHQTSIHTYRE